ncbi:MAG TPA: hypothetical protein VKV06_01100, partial [Acidimicrobiales bacterium]|nr:hypothetical protein [Acidimicrobiales bacterium]
MPGIIQQALPEHHGLAWYWRQWRAPTVRPDQRILLTFEAVDYTAAVWINGVAVGRHEGGETPFTFDVTDAVRPGTDNLLALRVLNPTAERIDGMVLEETPHANKAAAEFWPGRGYNSGGIVGDVCARVVPDLSIQGLTASADWRTGQLTVSLQVLSHRTSSEDATLELIVREDRTGVAVASGELECVARPGRVGLEAALAVPDAQSWDIDDPWLYSVEARISVSGVGTDSAAVKTGFRLFEIRN